jgi:hypothetical protein
MYPITYQVLNSNQIVMQKYLIDSIVIWPLLLWKNWERKYSSFNSTVVHNILIMPSILFWNFSRKNCLKLLLCGFNGPFPCKRLNKSSFMKCYLLFITARRSWNKILWELHGQIKSNKISSNLYFRHIKYILFFN